MRNLVGTLGKYRPKPKECWGFDCLYGAGTDAAHHIDDDANFWYDWVSNNKLPLYIFYGPTTLNQSVKLDLMGRGKATRRGNKADPPLPQIKGLHVIHSRYVAYATGGSIDDAVDRVLSEPPPTPPPPHRGPTTPKDADFVKQAADKMRAAYAFPDDVHYFIAKAFFLSQLKNANIL